MPRFFIDLHDGDTFLKDDTGIELDSTDLARAAAIRSLPELGSQHLLPLGDRRISAALVRDETGKYIFEAKLSLDIKWLKGD